MPQYDPNEPLCMIDDESDAWEDDLSLLIEGFDLEFPSNTKSTTNSVINEKRANKRAKEQQLISQLQNQILDSWQIQDRLP